MKRPSTQVVDSTSAASDFPCKLGSQYKVVLEFLADGKWEDGSPRETGTVMLVCSDGRLKAWVNDKANGRSAWVSGSSLTELLGRVEKGLEADSLDWRTADRKEGKAKR